VTSTRGLSGHLRMSKAQKLCIFCGEPGVTKEHVWPAWLLPYLPRDAVNHASLTETHHRTHVEREVHVHAGAPYSGRLRIVCRNCNNEWMSVLQNEAKPILLPLVLGEAHTLYRKHQKILAAWMAMFAMVAEFRSKTERRIAISPVQRRYLMDLRRPPAHWKIWIGYFEREQLKGVYFHNVLPIHKRLGNEPTTANGYPLPNTQTTSIVVGKLYAHMISAAGPGIVNRQRITTAPVVQLWPIAKSPLKWPRRPSLTDAEVEQLSMAFFRGAERRATTS
jgi:hypothetical protein